MQRLIRTSKQRDNYDCFVMAQQLVSFCDAIIKCRFVIVSSSCNFIYTDSAKNIQVADVGCRFF
ncbi:MAG: hypothetical protein U9R29_01730 [Thermodesulfobacteriota bacterium]|nr:hypothetical protein [Thermodesulfobacteriota bacterium]